MYAEKYGRYQIQRELGSGTMGMVYLILPSGIILIMIYLIGWMAVTLRLFLTSESSEKGEKE